MTLEEAIQAYKNLAELTSCYEKISADFRQLVGWLEELQQLRGPFKKPLTLEELQQMEGEPVDVEIFAEEGVGLVDLENNRIFTIGSPGSDLDIGELGITFCVYRHKSNFD